MGGWQQDMTISTQAIEAMLVGMDKKDIGVRCHYSSNFTLNTTNTRTQSHKEATWLKRPDKRKSFSSAGQAGGAGGDTHFDFRNVSGERPLWRVGLARASSFHRRSSRGRSTPMSSAKITMTLGRSSRSRRVVIAPPLGAGRNAPAFPSDAVPVPGR